MKKREGRGKVPHARIQQCMCMRGGAETTTLFKFSAVLLVAAVVVIVMVGLLDDRFHLFIEQVESVRRELVRREKKR